MADGRWAWLRGTTPTQVARREQAGSAPAKIAWFTAAFYAVVMTIIWLVTEDSSVVSAVVSSILSAVIVGVGTHRWLIWRETEG